MKSSLEAEFGGESLELLAAGAIHWRARRCLVVADAHFGKAATFRARGVPVPRGTTRDTLARLEAVRARTQPATLVFLGDLFHAPEAHAPATVEHLGTVGARHLHVRQHALHVRLEGERAHLGRRVHGIADADAARPLDKSRDELIGDRALHEDA